MYPEGLIPKYWLGKDYHPPRWMRREAYYKGKRLNRIRWKKSNIRMLEGFIQNGGSIGRYFAVRFIEEIIK